MFMFITVGSIGGTIGVHGELKVVPQSDHPGRLRKLPGMMVFVMKDGVREAYQVKSADEHQSFWKLRLEGVGSKEQAQALTGGELQISERELLPLPEGSFYLFELIGMSAYTDTGELLGEVTEVLQPGANDVYVVRRPDGNEVLIPAIKQVVLKIDREQHRMLIRPLPGLLGEDESDEG